MKFALVSLGFVLGLTVSAGAQYRTTPTINIPAGDVLGVTAADQYTVATTTSIPGVTAWAEISQQPGSLWRATSVPHVIESVTLQELCR